MANQMIFKTYTEKRMANMRKCDPSYYKFSADWSQPQTKSVCQKALEEVASKLALICQQKAWGSKPDTPEMITQLVFLVGGLKLGDDAQQNSFACYQAERYFFRVWYRGTKEEREKIAPKAPAKKAPAKKAPAKKAPAKKETAAPAPKKAQTKKDSTKKAPVVKATPTDTPVEPEVIDINAPDKNTAALLDSLCLWLQNELSAEQKHDLVVAMVSALAASEKMN